MHVYYIGIIDLKRQDDKTAEGVVPFSRGEMPVTFTMELHFDIFEEVYWMYKSSLHLKLE